MIKTLLRLSREAVRYRPLYVVAIFSTLALTLLNLAAPKLLSDMTEIVQAGVDEKGMHTILILTGALVGLYLLRILFRFLSNYLAHIERSSSHGSVSPSQSHRSPEDSESGRNTRRQPACQRGPGLSPVPVRLRRL